MRKLKILKIKSKLLKILSQKSKIKYKAIIIYGDNEEYVAFQIMERSFLTYCNKEFDNKEGFVIFLFFNNQIKSHKTHFESFEKSKHFSSFSKINKDGNENYFLDCNMNIYLADEIVTYLLKSIYNIKINDAKIELF